MGISRFFIWILLLRDIVDWSNMCLKNSVHASLELQQIFSLSLGHHKEIMLYRWKGLFNISNGSLTEFNFITCIRSYEWICSKTSTTPKTIFWLLLNHIVIMVKVQPHKTHYYGYGSTTQNPRLCIVITIRCQLHKTHGYGLTTENPSLHWKLTQCNHGSFFSMKWWGPSFFKGGRMIRILGGIWSNSDVRVIKSI